MKELDLQTRIIKEVRAIGGYGKKWASSWNNGVPDLILVHPWCGVVFAEVKLINVPSILSFRRKIHTTTLQRNEMEKIIEAGGKATLLVCIQHSMGGRLYSLDPLDRTITNETTGFSEWKKTKIYLGMNQILTQFCPKGARLMENSGSTRK